VLVAIGDADEAVLAAKFAVMRRVLDERQWRVYLGAEANALGYGGIAAVARAAGASENTVAAGAVEASDPEALTALAPGRSRRPGAGRPRAEDRRPGLTRALTALLEEGKRGDPMSEITWSTLSLRDIARQMALLGFSVSKDTIARLMRAGGWSLQGMSRVLEGSQHEDRDDQFRHINAQIAEFRAAGDPAVSVDAKKKELIGPYRRDGRSWRPAGDPVRVRDHDFMDRKMGRITPYGIYDIAANRGFVSVGTSHDTAAFAVSALRLWWQAEGSSRYPAARRLLVVCDAGGSNGYRCRLWKDQLAVLAEETGLEITVCHFPPGTSKWNKIEHRLFCHITRTWRARPLMTKEDAVAGIAATTTYQGLKVTAVLDEGDYPDGVKVSDERMKHLEERVVARHGAHGEWNYAVLPGPRPAPEPAPAPAPARPGRVPAGVLNHPALTGIPAADLTALAAALDVRFEARLQQRNYTLRGGPRLNAVRSGRTHGNRRLSLTDHLLALRLRDHLDLPVQVIAVLLGIDRSTVPHVTALAAGLLAAARITLPAAPPPENLPRSPAALLEYAAAAGIPLTIPENGQTMPDHFRTRRKPATRDTPETAN
jgi:Rhodopirellula transposase DDE domain